ncbi:cytochrome b/b6 domain-containing protein [Siccirubricoccus sp. G192]|uniref:cytochrome b/b6 domain-containing protein n=1 Tax=Siccirubricoccus sp. G192 TaxID=2849651 RepID=UPI001C2C60E7|nr:cytochrome b/b6 domain-containing protein [Siccirubricoccus sp. G192]MBV1797398.1 cytochrome b/b6 domain-containing protein [Siccirubricoccus sp. G192]
MQMRPVKVWDFWIRLVHWAIVLLIGLSWWAMQTNRVQLHFLSGYTVLTLVLFRLGWGLIGSDTARFARFLRSPLAALRHVARLRRREPDTEIGHNAAGGWMVLVLLGLLLTQALTGLFADSGYGDYGPLAKRVSGATSDWLTGIHHRSFNLILAAAGLHVLAVLAYRVLKGQNLVRPMVTGMKPLPATAAAPRMGSPRLAAALLGAAALLVYGVSRLG